MRIGIEGKVLTAKIGGIGRYAINLVRALLSISIEEHPDMEFVIFTAPQTDRSVLDGFGAVSCDRLRGIKSSLLRSSFFLSAGLVLEQIDVFHGLDQAGFPSPTTLVSAQSKGLKIRGSRNISFVVY